MTAVIENKNRFEMEHPIPDGSQGSAHFLRTGSRSKKVDGLELAMKQDETTLNDLTNEIYDTNPDLILQLESISQGKPDLRRSPLYYKEESVVQVRDEEYDTDLEIDEEDVGVPESIRQEKHDTTGSLSYLRRCSELGVVPVSYFLRHHDNPEFIMRFHGLGSKGTLALSRPLEKNTHITKLSLEGNCIESDGVISLCKMLNENLYITELGLADNCLGNSAVSYLYELLVNNNRILKLDLSANSLTDKSAAVISDMISKNTTLRHLNLRYNRFGDMSGTVFKDMLNNNDTLQELDLSWNLIQTYAALQIADGLKENVGLKVLKLRMNGFGLEGSKAIGHALIHNRTIQELDLSANRIPIDGAAALARAISVNESLIKIRLGSNPYGSAGALLIIQGARSNDVSALRLIDLIDVFVNGEFLAVKISFVAERPGLEVLHGACESDAMKHKKMAYDDSLESKKKMDMLKDMLLKNPITKMKDYMVKNGLRLIDFFKQLDRDQSMTISREEFVHGVEKFKMGLSEADIDRAIRMLDTDKSGDIDFAEFVTGDKEYKFLRRALLKEIAMLEEEVRKKEAEKEAEETEFQAISKDDMWVAVEEVITAFYRY